MSNYLRKLKFKHIVFLDSEGLDPDNFLLAAEDYESYTFVEKSTNRKLCMRY